MCPERRFFWILKTFVMRIAILLCSLLCLTTAAAFAQDVTGTWHGFQISRHEGKLHEYRVTLDFKVNQDNDVTGTMQLKSPLKGLITSSFTGEFDKKNNLIYLKENEILTKGITPNDARLCEYVLKVGNNSLKGTGRSNGKQYDHLELRLERGNNY
jgi:hypothetical protein